MSHKTCIKMLIVVNAHFLDSTPIIIKQLYYFLKNFIVNETTLLSLYKTLISRGFVHSHSLLAFTNRAFTGSPPPTNSGIKAHHLFTNNGFIDILRNKRG